MKKRLKLRKKERVLASTFLLFFVLGLVKFLSHNPAAIAGPVENSAIEAPAAEPEPAASSMSKPATKASSEAPPEAVEEQDSAPEAAQIDPRDFETQTAQLLKELPTKRDFQALNDEQAHETPEVVIITALKLGKITDQMLHHKELHPAALNFYTQCATMEDGIPAIQAICLKRARLLYRELNLTELDVAVNNEVEKLAW